MKSRTDGNKSRTQTPNQISGKGPNWVLIAGGVLLSTLSIRFGYKLKQALEAKQSTNSSKSLKGHGNSASRRKPGPCQLHSNMYCFTQDGEGCYYCHSGISESMVDMKRPPMSPISKESELALRPLVTVTALESDRKENGTIWAASPERLELPRRPFHHSNSSDSPCVSESGSDLFSKREVINKLRQQLKRRDEMILEMQAQITDLQNSLSYQLSQTAHLQSQLDAANRDVFDSEREIQKLRKAIADHCMLNMESPERCMAVGNHQGEGLNSQLNGFVDGMNDMELRYVVAGQVRGGNEWIEMLKREVRELKEVIHGKDFLLQSYKDQNMDLCSKFKDLELRVASQVKAKIIWFLSFLATTWTIWRCRNRYIFDKDNWEPSQAVDAIQRHVALWATLLKEFNGYQTVDIWRDTSVFFDNTI